jgi:hypothetical protein
MAMLTGYFDASGDNSAGDAVTVGGFMASVSEWRMFQRKWRAVLRDEGIHQFHMTDFLSGTKGLEK